MRGVECRGVTRQFGSGANVAQVLRGVDFEAPLGEVTMLVGPSGCGKTTLLSIVAGLLGPTSGELSVLGEDPFAGSDTSRVQFRRRNMGFIFQQYNLLPSLTAAENAAVGLLASGVGRAEAGKRARSVLARLGMESKCDALPRELSGGQQQRVAVARALVHEPRVVLCDEPTAALDAKSGRAVMEMMSEAAVSPDRAVVIVTHDSRIFEFADRVVSMEDGVITRVERQTRRTVVR